MFVESVDQPCLRMNIPTQSFVQYLLNLSRLHYQRKNVPTTQENVGFPQKLTPTNKKWFHQNIPTAEAVYVPHIFICSSWFMTLSSRRDLSAKTSSNFALIMTTGPIHIDSTFFPAFRCQYTASSTFKLVFSGSDIIMSLRFYAAFNLFLAISTGFSCKLHINKLLLHPNFENHRI